MADKFTFGSAGEIQEVEFALARNGWTHPLLTKATGGDFLGLVREVLEGRAEICRIERLTDSVATVPQYLIDCDAAPSVPSGFTVHSHTKGGQFAFDAKQVDLYLSELQKRGKVIEGHKLLKELANKPMLNACVLDYLLKNPDLIPESWKGKATFFFGTIYRNSYGSLFVRFLDWGGEQWSSYYYWLDFDWLDNPPVALRAS